MRNHALWHLDAMSGVDVAGRRFQEKKRLGWHSVVQLLGMISKVTPNPESKYGSRTLQFYVLRYEKKPRSSLWSRTKGTASHRTLSLFLHLAQTQETGP